MFFSWFVLFQVHIYLRTKAVFKIDFEDGGKLVEKHNLGKSCQKKHLFDRLLKITFCLFQINEKF